VNTVTSYKVQKSYMCWKLGYITSWLGVSFEQETRYKPGMGTPPSSSCHICGCYRCGTNTSLYKEKVWCPVIG